MLKNNPHNFCFLSRLVNNLGWKGINWQINLSTLHRNTIIQRFTLLLQMGKIYLIIKNNVSIFDKYSILLSFLVRKSSIFDLIYKFLSKMSMVTVKIFTSLLLTKVMIPFLGQHISLHDIGRGLTLFPVIVRSS